MNSRWIAVLVLLGIGGCKPDKQPATAVRSAAAPQAAPAWADTPAGGGRPAPDTAAGALTEQLRLIRTNYRRLNAVRRWEKVVRRELQNSTEGGEATYYFQDGHPAKIVAQNYGETFQHLAQYYLLPDGQLSFVLERATRYNRPYYYDSAAAKEMGDTEAFDLNKSTVTETRSYFAQGRLIQQLSTQPSGAAPADTLRQAEQKRLRADLTDLLQTLNHPN